MTSEIIPTPDSNKYTVVVRREPTSDVLMVTRSGAPQIKLNAATTEIADVLDGGRTYEYKFETYKDGKSRPVQLMNFSVPVPYGHVFQRNHAPFTNPPEWRISWTKF